VLKKVYGYSQKEIAIKLDISENTVEKHIATGIKRCTQFMAALHSNDSQQPMQQNSAPSERSRP